MDRARLKTGWPLADHSRYVRSRPHDWYVTDMGKGPLLLFLHGAGGSTHTWRDILPLLATDYRVVAIDLPGQGFTRAGTLTRCGLSAMTEDIAALCAQETFEPAALIGHSAGAAIALALSQTLSGPPPVIGINPALAHFEGIAGWLFPMLAKLLSLNPFTATIFTMGPNPMRRAERLIAGTGSTVDATGLNCYADLISDRAHAQATLQMMTQWHIDPLLAQLPEIAAPVLFITGDNDKAVPPKTSQNAAASMTNAEVISLQRLGHLAHEEAPVQTVKLIRAFLDKTWS